MHQESELSRPPGKGLFSVLALCIVVSLVSLLPMGSRYRIEAYFSTPAYAAQSAPQVLTPISIDYPEDRTIFPPGITAPTFLWRDAAGTSWSIDIAFADNSAPIHATSKGERMQIGPIDPDCVSDSNSPPKLNPQQAASWTWKPDPATWAAIQAHSVDKAATVTITGYRDGQVAFSQSRVTFSTSKDEVRAPIFYRDVPLMPASSNGGAVAPLAHVKNPSDPLAHPRHPQAGKPHSAERYAYLRQLPLVLGRRQDVRHGYRRAGE